MHERNLQTIFIRKSEVKNYLADLAFLGEKYNSVFSGNRKERCVMDSTGSGKIHGEHL
jgi:hypothetical protein